MGEVPVLPAALVFDFDGLILDTETPEFVTVRAEFEAHGLRLELTDWQRIVGGADHPHWLDWLEDELGAPVPARDDVLERRRDAHHALIGRNEVLPGVVALLDEARDAGVVLAVASSSPRSWVEGHLERLGLRDRFAAVCTRDDVERAKPWPDLYLAALDAVGAAASRAVALEDSHNGSVAAVAAGLYCVVVPNDITRTQDFSHADHVVGSLEDVDLIGLAEAVAARARS